MGGGRRTGGREGDGRGQGHAGGWQAGPLPDRPQDGQGPRGRARGRRRRPGRALVDADGAYAEAREAAAKRLLSEAEAGNGQGLRGDASPAWSATQPGFDAEQRKRFAGVPKSIDAEDAEEGDWNARATRPRHPQGTPGRAAGPGEAGAASGTGLGGLVGDAVEAAAKKSAEWAHITGAAADAFGEGSAQAAPPSRSATPSRKSGGAARSATPTSSAGRPRGLIRSGVNNGGDEELRERKQTNVLLGQLVQKAQDPPRRPPSSAEAPSLEHAQ